MKYAWANPTTGIREQDASEVSARCRLWEELQTSGRIEDSQTVYEQVKYGESTKRGVVRNLEEPPWVPQGYAWADPFNGKRVIVQFEEEIWTRFPEHSPIDCVIIYAQWVAFQVRTSDPEPPKPPAETNAPAGSLASARPELSDLRRQMQELFDAFNPEPLGKIQVLALLDIAESLRVMVGDLHTSIDMSYPKVEAEKQPADFFTLPDTPVCTCTGDGKRTEDGSFCSCGYGQELKRQAEVASRAPACARCAGSGKVTTYRNTGTVNASPLTPTDLINAPADYFPITGYCYCKAGQDLNRAEQRMNQEKQARSQLLSGTSPLPETPEKPEN